MHSLLQQIKQRRLALGFKQKDMHFRVGMSRQQYQRLESKGNPRLNTLELIAQGLKAELMLIPTEKREAVLVLLEGDESEPHQSTEPRDLSDDLSDNPWQGLLGDE